MAPSLLDVPENVLPFSPVSLWEIVIKRGLRRETFEVDPRALRRGLLDNEYQELPIRGEHAVAIDGLPAIHKGSFVLVAQSLVEGIVLLTSDPVVAKCHGPIRQI
jgi:PIN domain nuclease of toxin-antitoxin system